MLLLARVTLGSRLFLSSGPSHPHRRRPLKRQSRRVQWCMLAICTGKLRQKDQKFKVRLGCVMMSCLNTHANTHPPVAGEVAQQVKELTIRSLVT